jgi:hypothetical protein
VTWHVHNRVVNTADPVKVYRPQGRFFVIPVIGLPFYLLIGIGMLADAHETGWSGVVVGVLLLGLTAVITAVLSITSVTTYEQGVVIRQYLLRQSVPWHAMDAILLNKSPGLQPIYRVRIRIPIGNYRVKRKTLVATSGSKAYAETIVAEMQQLRDHALTGDRKPSVEGA